MECCLSKKEERRIKRGEYAETLEDYFKILSSQRTTLGNDHEETLCTQTKIALVHEKAGKLDRALAELQTICRKYDSKSHPSQDDVSRLQAKYRLANVLEKLGQDTRARDIKRYVEETLKYLAREYEYYSQSENALNYFRSAKRYLNCAISFLGPDHEATLRMGEVVGDMHRINTDYRGALKTYKKVLSLKMDLAEREDHLPLRIKLASMEVELEQYEDALKSYEGISETYENCGIADYISVCEIDMCIVKIYRKLDNRSKAEEAFNIVKIRLKDYADKLVELRGILSTEFHSEICRERRREIAEKEYDLAKKGFHYMWSVLTLNNEDTLRLGWVVGFMCRLLDKYGESLQLYEQVYETSLLSFGSNHSLTINSCLDRVSLLRSLCRLQDAFAVLNDFSDKRNKSLGIAQETYDDVTLKIQYESANIFYQEGTYAQAQQLYDSVSRAYNADDELKLDARRMLMKASHEVGHHERVVAIIEEFYNEFPNIDPLNVMQRQTKGVIRFLCDIAGINEQCGEYDSAVLIYESMNGVCRARGVDFPLHMETKIAIIRAKQNRDDDHVQTFLELITKCEQINNPGHFLTSSIRKGLLMAYFRRHDFPNAFFVYSNLLTENEMNLGPYHSDTLKIKYLAAKCFLGAALPNQLLNVKQMFEKIRELRYAVHFPFHPDCLSVDYYLAVTNEKMGYFSEAFQIYCDIYSKTEFFYGVRNPYLPNIKIRIDNIADRIAEPNLIIATYGDNLEAVVSCLRNGDDINARGNNGFTSLHIASWRGYTDILKCLLQHGASYKIKNWEWKTPADYAYDHEITRIFRQADQLFASIKNNDIENVKRIIRRDIPLVNAKDENGFSPLHCACYEGSHFIVQFLLMSGADVKSRTFRGYLSFHLAAIKGDNDMIILLLKYIEDIREDVLEIFNDNKNDEGATPLHLAALKNRVYTVYLLRGTPAYREKRDKLRKLPIDVAAEDKVKHFLRSGKIDL